MNSKTSETINSAFGVPGEEPEYLEVSSTACVSGELLPDSVYRFDSDVDVSFALRTTNDGPINKQTAMTLFGGQPEEFSTPHSYSGDEDENIVWLVSGETASGKAHATIMHPRS